MVCTRRGFERLETSAIEDLAALGKFLPDLDQPNEGVFAWREDKGWLALRYDLTAPLARVAAQYGDQLPSPYRRFAAGPVWRNEKPGPGRYRQFYQFDADTVGSANPAADAEMCALATELVEAAGIERGGYLVRINNRKLLDAVLDQAGVPVSEESNRRGIVLRAIDKLDRIGIDGVRKLLAAGRLDDSGDFTDGAELAAGQIDLVMELVACHAKSDAATLAALRDLVGVNGSQAVDEIERICTLLEAQGIGADQARIDPSVVRGLAYYTGAVFEVVLTSDAREAGFGAVAGGGRYDGLVKRFTGHDVPATGISMGVDRMLAVLAARRTISSAPPGPVLVTVMDADRMAEYQIMAAELRKAGIAAEVYLGNARNFGRQMKYADRRSAPAVIIQGADERARGSVQIKDLRLGRAIAATASHAEWKSRPAQNEVPRAELVHEVRRVMAMRDDQIQARGR